MKYKCNEFGCNGYPYVYGIEDPIGVTGAQELLVLQEHKVPQEHQDLKE